MSDIDHAKKTLGVRERVIAKLWAYMDDNFHKFSEANKMKLMVAICGKNIPQQLDGEIRYTAMSTIKIHNEPLNLDIGDDLPESLKTRMN
jgi:hypothetical protein